MSGGLHEMLGKAGFRMLLYLIMEFIHEGYVVFNFYISVNV